MQFDEYEFVPYDRQTVMEENRVDLAIRLMLIALFIPLLIFLSVVAYNLAMMMT